jgi:RimJ/RimL family protein N-acetyltransferase
MHDSTSAVEVLCGTSAPARIPVPRVTERLELRPFREEDIQRFAGFMADSETTKFIGGPKSLAAAAESVRYMRDAFAGRGWGTLAVIQRDDNACIGYCGVRPLQNTPHVELAFALDRTSWHCGYATEASSASLDLAFRYLAVDAVFATVYPENQASVRVLTKLGMSRYGSIFGVWPRNSALLFRVDQTSWRARGSKGNDVVTP